MLDLTLGEKFDSFVLFKDRVCTWWLSDQRLKIRLSRARTPYCLWKQSIRSEEGKAMEQKEQLPGAEKGWAGADYSGAWGRVAVGLLHVYCG